MTDIDMVDLISKLTEELGVALELSYQPEEFTALWPEALDALTQAKLIMTSNGRPFPGAAENVLQAAKRFD